MACCLLALTGCVAPAAQPGEGLRVVATTPLIADLAAGYPGRQILRDLNLTLSPGEFTGLAIAFVLGGSLMLGGLVAGVITAVLVAVFSQNQRLKEDSVIGIFFAGSFALGITIISLAPGYSGSVQDFLFGSIVGISTADVVQAGVIALVILLVLGAFHKEIVTVSLDKESARAAGLPVLLLDVVLYVTVTVSVVISLQTLGNVLVLALLVVPASAARLVCARLTGMMVFAPVFGVVCATVGLYLSWAFNLPTGGVIVLTMIAGFLVCWAWAGVRARVPSVFPEVPD